MALSRGNPSKRVLAALRRRLWPLGRRIPCFWLCVVLILMGGALLAWHERRPGPTQWSRWLLMVISQRLRYEPFVEEHGLPGNDAELAQLFVSQGWSQEDQVVDFIVEGRFVDRWGHPLVYRRDTEARYGYYLYSTGWNGLDEGGRGDDMAFHIDEAPEYR